jgi:hypothetical protein
MNILAWGFSKWEMAANFAIACSGRIPSASLHLQMEVHAPTSVFSQARVDEFVRLEAKLPENLVKTVQRLRPEVLVLDCWELLFAPQEQLPLIESLFANTVPTLRWPKHVIFWVPDHAFLELARLQVCKRDEKRPEASLRLQLLREAEWAVRKVQESVLNLGNSWIVQMSPPPKEWFERGASHELLPTLSRLRLAFYPKGVAEKPLVFCNGATLLSEVICTLEAQKPVKALTPLRRASFLHCVEWKIAQGKRTYPCSWKSYAESVLNPNGLVWEKAMPVHQSALSWQNALEIAACAHPQFQEDPKGKAHRRAFDSLFSPVAKF